MRKVISVLLLISAVLCAAGCAGGNAQRAGNSSLQAESSAVQTGTSIPQTGAADTQTGSSAAQAGNTAQQQTAIKDSGDAQYEAMTIQIEGIIDLDGGIAEISVAELRALPQLDMQTGYRRTTGLYEDFRMSGPRLSDVISYAGGNLDDYAGLGVIGRDNYYCLFSRELLDSTPDLIFAVTIDGESKLDADNAPARAAVPDQFGPYWVKQISKVVLYQEIPVKNITSVWVFRNLTAGISPVEYEYYGSTNHAIDLEQVFSRLDYVDSKAFFTMKSADGFKKNEAMNMVKSRYYIKIDGEDAPTNVAPYIKLGMNVQRISWVSTNADAAVFPAMLTEYLSTETVNGQTGIPLDELLYEVEVKTVRTAEFDLLGTAGERIRVPGADLCGAILVPLPGGGGKVLWSSGYEYPDIDDLLRIRTAG